MVSFLVSLLALAPASTLLYGAAASGEWNVQRLRRDCGQGGCNQEFYVNGERLTSNSLGNPNSRDFDSYCTGLAFGGEWTACRSQIPYTTEGGFARMSAIDRTSGAVEVWFTWLNPDGGRPVNETGRIVVEGPKTWDVAQCRQMTIVSKQAV